MRVPTRRSQKFPQPSPVIAAEVRVDIHPRPSITISSPPPPRITLLRPLTVVTSSNLFHPSQKLLHSTSRSSGASTLIHPLSSMCHLKSRLEIPPYTTPRSAQQMVTIWAMPLALWASPDPQGPFTSAQTRILPGQVRYDAISCRVRMALSRGLVDIHDRNQEAALELLIPRAAARVLERPDVMSQAFAGYVGSRGTFDCLRSECALSGLCCETYVAEDP